MVVLPEEVKSGSPSRNRLEFYFHITVRAFCGRLYEGSEFSKHSGGEFRFDRLPVLFPAGQFRFSDVEFDRTACNIDANNVAVFNEPNGTANSGFWSNVTDTEASCTTGETTIGQQQNIRA